ncbi:MAG: hypothetical protein A2749_00455 [Parcubacteria group bacterium RIFCSPHIGHO2_01_FULL_45_26]|nr:MAG: hypothetical protein A2749_00455 [Parcubacteria group bacterium RIFCSPHIGHO2_01_FULL_45_26]
MPGKTNKSFTKRLRITSRGKVLARKAGRNHFNSKASGRNQQAGKRTSILKLGQKTISLNLPFTRA